MKPFFAGTLFIIGLLAAPMTMQAQSPAGWKLTLEWSPEYCHQHRGSRALQCEEEHYLIVSRLRGLPVVAAASCAVAPLSADLVEQVHPEIPDRELIRRMWTTDGACSGLPPSEYMVQLSRATRRLAIPETLKDVRGKLEFTRGQLHESFASTNPELSPDGMIPRCDGKYLTEIQVCLAQDFSLQACTGPVESNCPASFFVRGVPDGRRRKLR